MLGHGARSPGAGDSLRRGAFMAGAVVRSFGQALVASVEMPRLP